MAKSLTSRRAVLGSVDLAAAMVASAGATAQAGIGPVVTLVQINEAEQHYRTARQAFDDALAAYEAVLPPPHPDIDMTERRGQFDSAPEARLFDNARPKRITNPFGYPDLRWVATEDTLVADWRRCQPGNRRRRKAIARMLRRSQRRQAEMMALEKAHRLAELEIAAVTAERRMQELGVAIFAEPATTMAAVQVQARMLQAYALLHGEQWAVVQAGHWGTMLATSLCELEAAA